MNNSCQIFKPSKLKPLDKYAKYIFYLEKLQLLVKQTKILEKEIKKELFNPTRKDNKATPLLVVKLGAYLAACLIKEMLDPTRLTSQHLSIEGGNLSWSNTTQQEHEARMGKEATNDNTESPFGSLTAQL